MTWASRCLAQGMLQHLSTICETAGYGHRWVLFGGQAGTCSERGLGCSQADYGGSRLRGGGGTLRSALEGGGWGRVERVVHD